MEWIVVKGGRGAGEYRVTVHPASTRITEESTLANAALEVQFSVGLMPCPKSNPTPVKSATTRGSSGSAPWIGSRGSLMSSFEGEPGLLRWPFLFAHDDPTPAPAPALAHVEQGRLTVDLH